MVNMIWLDESHIHKGTLDGAVQRANDFSWDLRITQSGRMWAVTSGSAVVFKTDSRDSLDTFLYGFGLAYGVPEAVLDPILSARNRR